MIQNTRTSVISPNADAAFQVSYFVSLAKAAGSGTIDERDALLRYRSEPDLRRLSPNPLFDELWYRLRYPRIGSAIEAGEILSGFYHYCQRGHESGFMPNAAFDIRARALREPEEACEAAGFDAHIYRTTYPEVVPFMNAFPFMKAVDAFNSLGRFIGHSMQGDSVLRALVAREFDADFYVGRYGSPEMSKAEALRHYLEYGMADGHSPSPDFDEEWYLTFYKDIREAKRRGEIRSGFAHFLVSGRNEGRVPKPELKGALEAAAPGVTAPTLLKGIRAVELRTTAKRVQVVPSADRTFWIVCPRINPDLVFGGYKALFELTRRLKPYLASRGVKLGFILTEEAENRDYVLYRYRSRPDDAALFADAAIVSILETDEVSIGPRDRFLSYSCWDAWQARACAAATDEPRFFSLIQEYEPIFHAYGSLHAMGDAAFRLPQYAIFNSEALCDYFQRHRLGIFSDNGSPSFGDDYACFEHVPTKLPLQSVESMASRRDKWCLVYARPESHAMRNLFEIEVLALRKACAEGVFDSTWRFMGLGALDDHRPVALGGGHSLEMKAKLPEEEYRALVDKVDIGLSLMYAPHPSVVPFEFAATGALVVTNRFDGRDDAFFKSVSKNIVPCDPTIEGVAEGLRMAAARHDDYHGRHDGALRLNSLSWDRAFDVAFFDRHFAWAIDPSDVAVSATV